ncbi:PREDICTED: uncharacterized protein LOC106805972 [Priapulus caudatus]|uniref:Uncharacterized protein LOC106805972 n=1 Tax=Priapulus caudatus TaxID=37621 RepID=A0ABM1DTJ7_PRICU|nr:PREDICTED: uncharacterized protein LOC106805972 [Priapulus caudatus]
MADGCSIREAIESDLPHVIKWWEEYFNVAHEIEMFKIVMKYGKGGGAFTAVLPSGEPVGFVTCAVIGDMASANHLIVRGDMRGTRIESMLYKRADEHVGHLNVAINSAMHLIEFYKKNKFTTESFTITDRYYTVDHAKIAASLKLGDEANIMVKPYSEEMLQAVLGYDRTIAGNDRGDYLRPCLQAYKKLMFVATDAESKVAGYVIAVNMTGRVSHGICPLYGDTEQVQCQLMRQVLMALPDGSEICIYTPDDNIPATMMVEALGARTKLITKRLYTKHEVKLPLDKVASTLDWGAFII